MTDAQRLSDVQDALPDMRDDIRTKQPTGDRIDPARWLVAALARRGLRVVSDVEWDEKYQQGVDWGYRMCPRPVTTDEEILDEALSPRY